MAKMKIGTIFDLYFQKFSKRGKRTSRTMKMVWSCRQFLSPSWSGAASIERFLFMQNQSPDSQLSNIENAAIEVLYVSKAEDLEVLLKSINQALHHILNPITSIVVVVPSQDLEKTRYLLAGISYPIKVISEEKIVSPEVIKLISSIRPDRFGWILQQVIVAQYVLDSDSPNILVIDADTMITHQQAWIDDEGLQILMPSYELHLPYYNFFRFSSDKYPEPKVSFVSHHQLIQTGIFKEIFEIWDHSIYKALESAFKFSSPNNNSPFDLKYEIYSQYLYHNYPQLVRLVKWSNKSISKKEYKKFFESPEHDIFESKDYNSMSFHHWNR